MYFCIYSPIVNLYILRRSQNTLPIRRIEVDEYECVKCGWKWINRVNGTDNLRPQRCAKCKRWDWNTGHVKKDTEMKTLRNRVKYTFRYYRADLWKYQWAAKLFLAKSPAINEMQQVLEPIGNPYNVRKNKLSYEEIIEELKNLQTKPLEEQNAILERKQAENLENDKLIKGNLELQDEKSKMVLMDMVEKYYGKQVILQQIPEEEQKNQEYIQSKYNIKEEWEK